MKKSFILYNDQYEAVEELTGDQKGQLLDLMFLYSRGEELNNCDPIVKVAFKFFKIVFDRDNEKWKAVADRNKLNGRKGGRPKGSKNNKVDENPEEPRKPTGLNGFPEKPRKAVSGSGSGSGNVSGSVKLVEDKKNKEKIPPSLKDVSDYCQERNNGIDPQGFIDYYEANGWMRGKTKIKSWKACLRTWEKNNKKKQEPTMYATF